VSAASGSCITHAAHFGRNCCCPKLSAEIIVIDIKGWGHHGMEEMARANAFLERTQDNYCYEGQAHGANEQGVGYIEAQSCHNAVQDLYAVLRTLGFASVEEMMAAANL
jgi:hypothetical protein